MATYLLDTHCLIWFQDDSPRIPKRIMNILQSPANTILFSQISLFEITIKQKVGKLSQFVATIQDVFNQAESDGFTFLPISNNHLYHYNDIPLFEQHRDPFDRLLLATALVEKVSLLSADVNFNLYNESVNVIW